MMMMMALYTPRIGLGFIAFYATPLLLDQKHYCPFENDIHLHSKAQYNSVVPTVEKERVNLGYNVQKALLVLECCNV